MRNAVFLFLALCTLITACGGDPVYTPKPRSFPRVIYPERGYQNFDKDYCQFGFQYPTYVEVQQDTIFFDEAPPSDCWFDLYYPDYDGRIHFTYVDLQEGKQSFQELLNDAFNMADWHNKRADYIDELRINNPQGVGGIAFDISGDVASPFQFFLTDSTQHYVRGSLYFNTQAKADSLQPVVDFVREDILKIIETFEWK